MTSFDTEAVGSILSKALDELTDIEGVKGAICIVFPIEGGTYAYMKQGIDEKEEAYAGAKILSEATRSDKRTASVVDKGRGSSRASRFPEQETESSSDHVISPKRFNEYLEAALRSSPNDKEESTTPEGEGSNTGSSK